jgi:hypothetical protein
MRDISINLEIFYTELISVCLLVWFFFQVFEILKNLQVAFRFADSVVCSYKCILYSIQWFWNVQKKLFIGSTKLIIFFLNSY